MAQNVGGKHQIGAACEPKEITQRLSDTTTSHTRTEPSEVKSKHAVPGCRTICLLERADPRLE